MKKIITFAALAIAGASLTTAHAEAAGELVANIHNGEPVTVNWENPMVIDADNFADAKAGMYVYITLETSDTEGNPIELHDRMDGSFTFLPGTVETFLGSESKEYRYYITPAGLTMLQANGMEICGKDFTVNTVDIYNDGFSMSDEAVWGGYFWVDSWNTLNLYTTAFKVGYEYKYVDFVFAKDEVTSDDYVINFMTAWDNPDAVIGKTENNDFCRYHANAYMSIDNATLDAALENKTVAICQFDKGSSNPFNLVEICLARKQPITGADDAVADIAADNCADMRIFNLQGIYVGDSLDRLPAGIYIRGGKKIMK